MNGILPKLLLFSVLYDAATVAAVRKEWTEATTLEESTDDIPGHNVPTMDPSVRTAGITHPTPHGPWSQGELGDPRVDVWACGNEGSKSHVCNPDRVLTREEVITLDEVIHNTTCLEDVCDGGYRINVVVIRRIDLQEGFSFDERRKGLASFTEHVRLGMADDGPGERSVLILLVTEDKMVYTAVGPEASESLSKGCIEKVYHETKHYYDEGEWADGLSAMINSYGEIAHGSHDCLSHAGFHFTVIGLSVFGGLAACCGLLWLRKCCWTSRHQPDLALYQLPEEQAVQGPGVVRVKEGGPVPASPWWSKVRSGSEIRIESGS